MKYKICLSRHTLSRQGTDYTWNPGWLRRFQQDQNKFFKGYGTGLYAFFETGHALKSSKQIFQHALSVKAYLLSVGTEKLHQAENRKGDLKSHSRVPNKRGMPDKLVWVKNFSYQYVKFPKVRLGVDGKGLKMTIWVNDDSRTQKIMASF